MHAGLPLQDLGEENMKVTAIIQCYRRPKYLKEQVRAIENQTMPPDSIWIVHNEGGRRIKVPKGRQLIYAKPNMKFHLRFAVGLLAEPGFVAFFDDDTVPGRRWIDNCLDTISKQNSICVTVGVIVDGMRQVKVGWPCPNELPVRVDFGGHAWFMRTETLRHMWREDILERSNGEDIMLSANCQRFAAIPTIVPPHPQLNLSLWGSDPFKAQRYGSDNEAHWLTQPTHFEERHALIQKYVEKGWILQREMADPARAASRQVGAPGSSRTPQVPPAP